MSRFTFDHVAQIVPDIADAVAWYQAHLGASVLYQDATWAFVEVGGARLAFVVKDKIELLPLAQIDYALEKGFITGDTLYFNNTVTNKAALASQWIVPVSKSWLAKKLARH